MSAKVQGYLPTDRPDLVTSLVSGFQILVAIFPATVLVAVLTKFDVGATLFTSGVSTLAALLGSRNRIPFYYGSSFSFIAAVTAIVAANGTMGVQIAQGGIVAGGVVEVLAGLLVYYLGKKWIDRILPPILTGSIAMVIGIGLAKAAWITAPHLTLPIFDWRAIAAIAPIALATIPESTAHLYQLSLYVDAQAEAMGRPKQGMSNLLPLSLALDGVADLINGLFGGPAGTNYGEANSTMAISRNYTAISVILAGVFAILLAFVGKLAAVVNTMPVAVIGGLAIYLFGVIAKQGVALIAAEKVDLTDTRNLAIGSTVLIIGIGGNIFPGGNLPGSLLGIKEPPAIAAAAVFGLLLNLFFIMIRPEKVESAMGVSQAGD